MFQLLFISAVFVAVAVTSSKAASSDYIIGDTPSVAGNVNGTLHPDNGLDRGKWGEEELCPRDELVIGFELKNEKSGLIDKTGVNALKLYCYDPTGNMDHITSSEGESGDWIGIRICPNTTTRLIGVRLEVLPNQGRFGDDIGVTNVQMFCSETFQILDGLKRKNNVFLKEEFSQRRNFLTYGTVTLENGRRAEKIKAKVPSLRDDPLFGTWMECPLNTSLCGLQTRVEPEHVINDDAGLTDVIFFCCTE